MGTRIWTDQTYSRFRDARELVEDDERGGRPKSIRTGVNIAAVADLVKNYRLIASIMRAESLNIPKTVVLRILTEDLGKRIVCTFCSTLLEIWAKGISSHILPRHYRDGWCRQNSFNKIIAEDETWCFAYDAETKRQSSEWVGETSPRPKKLKFQSTHIKTMLIIFFRLSGRSAQRIPTRGISSKCRIL